MNHTICAIGLLPALALGGGIDAKGEFRALLKEYEAELATYTAEIERLESTGGDVETYRSDWNPAPVFVDIMAEKAAEYARTDDAVRFLDWIVQYDPMESEAEFPEAATAALRTLISDHATNEDFVGGVVDANYRAYFLGKPRVIAELGVIIDLARDTELEVSARFARVQTRMRDGKTSPQDREECMADLTIVRERMGVKRRAEIEGVVFELQNLQIGQVAPEITAADLDGVEFNLSDYRGKVVMLDFWGDW